MKYFSKSDVFFTVAIVIGAIIVLVLLNFRSVGSQIEIKHEGKSIVILPLNKDTTYEIQGKYKNIIEIKDGNARVSFSDCPNKVCLKGSVSKTNSSVVCAPNSVSITVLGEGGIDALTG